MALPYQTISWIGLTSLTPLSALLTAWTLVSIHRKRTNTKSILLLALVYAQLILLVVNFGFSTLTLLRIEGQYVGYLAIVFNTLVLFKSFTLLSLHWEEFYKIKSPSNYLLNVNSSLLRYHLLVLLLLSGMGAYFLRETDFIPTYCLTDDFLLITYVTFHSSIILLSSIFLILKVSIKKSPLDLNLIIGGTNSTTTSSTNLFGLRDGTPSSLGRLGIATSGVGAINLLINSILLACTFWIYWFPLTWPLINVILWTQVIESLLTPLVYWTVQARQCGSGHSDGNCSQKSLVRYGHHHNHNHHHPHQGSSQSVLANRGNGSLCFNNGEFQYFAGGKVNRNNRHNNERILNNVATSSDFNTYDSFHQTLSYADDSLRCASVTTIANDDFEFISRGHGISILHPDQYQPQTSLHQYNGTITLDKSKQKQNGGARTEGPKLLTSASLSMNDLDLIGGDDENPLDMSTIPVAMRDEDDLGKYKYKKKPHPIPSPNKRKFPSKGLTNRRVLSLESLHSPPVNDSQLAYLDTGERVIVFTTDFI